MHSYIVENIIYKIKYNINNNIQKEQLYLQIEKKQFYLLKIR